MSDEHGVNMRSSYDSEYGDSRTALFVGIIIALALLSIAYLVFSAGRDDLLKPEQVRCMIANPGMECEQIKRWEPIDPAKA
jgi:hypothetical protein